MHAVCRAIIDVMEDPGVSMGLGEDNDDVIVERSTLDRSRK